MSDGAESKAAAGPVPATAGDAGAGVCADAAAPSNGTQTLGGVDVLLLTRTEFAAGVGDAQAMTPASGKVGVIGNVTALDRPLRRTVLHWASFGGNPTVVKEVLEAVARKGAYHAGDEAEGAAIATSEALQAVCLREPGACDGTTPLHLAAAGGHAAAVVTLLEAGADDTRLDEYHNSPLCRAIELGHTDAALELVRRGAAHVDDQTVTLGTALHKAAFFGRLEVAKALLQAGATVNIPNQIGHTPLHMAPNSGPNAPAIIELLVAAGAAVEAVGGIFPFDKTPLLAAVMGELRGKDRAPSIRALVAAGADPHSDVDCSLTPVEMAMADQDSTEALSAFLEVGVDPNHVTPIDRQPYGGASLLHIAARALHDGAVKLLLAAGAREDRLAFDIADDGKVPEVTGLPADVIGVEVEEDAPLFKRRVDAIRGMLAGAHLYRKGWLSILRDRFDAGERLTGGDGAGTRRCRSDGGNDGVEGPPPQRQKGEGHNGDVNGSGMVAVEDEAWHRVAVWMASVPGSEIFRAITDFL